jgi:hypothetical protein
MVTINPIYGMPKRTKATVPTPTETLPGLRASVEGLKEIVEVLDGQRGELWDTAVTWRDLVQIGVVKYEQVPAKGKPT